MGFSTWHWLEKHIKMFKSIAAACLIAVAFAEPEAKADADPALLYSSYGYGLGAYGYRLGAYGHRLGYGYGHYLGKRSADAEPEAEAEADPALLYSTYGYGLRPYAGYAGYGYGLGAYGYGLGAYGHRLGYGGYSYLG